MAVYFNKHSNDCNHLSFAQRFDVSGQVLVFNVHILLLGAISNEMKRLVSETRPGRRIELVEVTKS